MIQSLTLLNSEQFGKVTNQELSLIAFGVPWSPPCQSQHKILVTLTTSYGDIMTIARVDVENYPEIAEKNNIQTVPTLIVYKKNKEIKRLVGFQSFAALQTLVLKVKGMSVATYSGRREGTGVLPVPHC